MSLQYLFDPNTQFQSRGGVNEVGGFLRVFFNGTDDRATTYCNFDGGMNEPDIVLDTDGRAVVIVDDTKTYRLEVYNRFGGLMWTVTNYKARGGGGGGSGTPVSVEGTVDEIDVTENSEGGIKHFVVSLANAVKTALSNLQSSITSLSLSLNGKKNVQTPSSFNGSTTKTLVGISQDANGEMSATFDDIAFPDWTSAINAAVANRELTANKKTSVTGNESSNTYYPTIKAVVDFVNGMILPFYPQSLGYMTPDEREALNAKMNEVAYNGGTIILWGGINSNIPSVLSFYGTNEYCFYRIEKNGNKIVYYEEIVTYDPVTKTFNVDSSSTIIDPSLYEKLANKKNTLVGYESNTTVYPSIKAVVDFVNSAMQNLGGKLITDNGDPFTDSSDLPSTTPYHGVDIADKDYAYIQNAGSAERCSATVSGTSVTWVQEYSIRIPVFTPTQQDAIDSTVNSTKVGNYDAHLNNTNNPHNVTAAQVGALTPSGNGSNVTASFTQAGSRANISTGEKLSVILGKISKWFADLKSVAFSGSYTDLSDKPTIPAAANNGILTIKQNGTSKGTFSANQSGNNTIELTDTTKAEVNNNASGNILFTTSNTSGTITPHIGNNLSVDPTKGFTGVMAGTIGANSTLGFNIDVSGFNNHIIPTSSGDSLRDFLSKVKKLQVDMDAAPNCVPIDCAVESDITEPCFYLYIYRGFVGEGIPVRLTVGELWKVIKGFIGSTSATGLGLDKDYYTGTAYNAIYDDVGNQIRVTYATRTALSKKSTSAYNEVNTTTPDANVYLYFRDIDMSVRLEIKNVSSTYYYGLVMKRNVNSESIQVSGSAMLTSQASGQPSPNSEIKRIWTSVNNVSWSNFGHFTVLQANASVDYAATGKIQFKCGSFMVSVDVSITKAGADTNAYVFMTGYTSPCVAGHNYIPVV